jgi:hypothetical protein
VKNKKTRLELLAEFSARMQLTPDLFDEACRRAAEKIPELDRDKLASLAGPVRLRPGEIDLIMKIFPPDGPQTMDGSKRE